MVPIVFFSGFKTQGETELPIILNKETVKELIQSEVNSKNIKKELNLILSDKKEKIKEDYKSLRKLLYGRDIEKKIIEHINKN